MFLFEGINASTPQLPFKEPQSDGDQKALDRGTLGGVGTAAATLNDAQLKGWDTDCCLNYPRLGLSWHCSMSHGPAGIGVFET